MGGLLDLWAAVGVWGPESELQLTKRNHDQIVTENDRFQKLGVEVLPIQLTGESRPTNVAMTDKPVQIG